MIPTRAEWKAWEPATKVSFVAGWAGTIGFFLTCALLLWDNYHLRTQSLHLSVGPFVESLQLDVREGYGSELPWQVTFAFPVALVNEGLRPLVLTDYELIPKNCDFTYTFRGQDGDQGLFLAPEDESPITLPISLPAGEARTYFLKTAVVVTSDVADHAFALGPQGKIRDLLVRAIINKEGVSGSLGQDFFGNSVEYGVGVRGLFDWQYRTPARIRQPVYQLVFRSAQGRSFSTRLAPFGPENTYPYSENCAHEAFKRIPQLQLDPDDKAAHVTSSRVFQRRR